MSVDLPRDAGVTLVPIARRAVTDHLAPTTPQAVPRSAWLDAPGASFVTLTRDGRLRGCIGTLSAHRPLVEDVRANAVAAAVRDPRFPPVRADEVATVQVEVSVLSAPERLGHLSRAEAEAILRPRVDGVILDAGRSRGTFLPQVWEHLPSPAAFLDHLIRKAQLPPGYWGEDITLWTYTVTAWHETSPGGPVDLVPPHD